MVEKTFQEFNNVNDIKFLSFQKDQIHKSVNTRKG